MVSDDVSIIFGYEYVVENLEIFVEDYIFIF